MPDLAVADGARAYARLKAEVVGAGLLERSRTYYALLIVFALGGYAASVAGIVLLDGYVLLGAACLSFSFFSVQTAGLMHDSGHRAVFTTVRANDVLGYLAAGLLGMVFDNWKVRHNAHHAHPNQVDMDPDMEIPLLATDRATYDSKGGLRRRLMRYQAFYYYPLGSIVSLSNRLGSISYFLRGRSRSPWKLALYGAGLLFLFVAPFAAFPLEKAAFVFAVVHVSTGVYLANCFAPNHKGMPQVGRDAALSFLEQQVITSRNVRGGFLTDLALVGLNYQVEHHLFPSCPRNKLRLLQPYVRKACAEAGIEYVEAGLVETNRELLAGLHRVSRPAAPAAAS